MPRHRELTKRLYAHQPPPVGLLLNFQALPLKHHTLRWATLNHDRLRLHRQVAFGHGLTHCLRGRFTSDVEVNLRRSHSKFFSVVTVSSHFLRAKISPA
ncbi:MAG: hypothetical protein QOG73_3071 [Acetobacteraceae bacterium]|jgi:hypothetical protein|nr:hypothetical protein [Acetobacteraceae bacterium]